MHIHVYIQEQWKFCPWIWKRERRGIWEDLEGGKERVWLWIINLKNKKSKKKRKGKMSQYGLFHNLSCRRCMNTQRYRGACMYRKGHRGGLSVSQGKRLRWTQTYQYFDLGSQASTTLGKLSCCYLALGLWHSLLYLAMVAPDTTISVLSRPLTKSLTTPVKY